MLHHHDTAFSKDLASQARTVGGQPQRQSVPGNQRTGSSACIWHPITRAQMREIMCIASVA